MKSPRPGGTENISVSMPSELLGALRTRTGKRGVSAYVAAAVRHQLAMDGLAEIVAAYEAEHEPLSEAEIKAAQHELFGRTGAVRLRQQRRMKEPAARSLVLDSQALSLLLRNDRQMVTRIEAARRVGVPVLVSALTVVEAVYGKTDTARLHWMLSRLQVQDVTQADSLTAVQLLSDAGGLHGHKYAIDALVAAIALRSPAPVLVLTSDRDDWAALCGDRIQIKDV